MLKGFPNKDEMLTPRRNKKNIKKKKIISKTLSSFQHGVETVPWGAQDEIIPTRPGTWRGKVMHSARCCSVRGTYIQCPV